MAAARRVFTFEEDEMDPTTPPPEPQRYDEIKVTGENLLRTIRELIREGNYRRIIIRNEQGHTLLEIPLTLGLVGALLMPGWAAIGAMAAMAGGFSIIVERPRDPDAEPRA